LIVHPLWVQLNNFIHFLASTTAYFAKSKIKNRMLRVIYQYLFSFLSQLQMQITSQNPDACLTVSENLLIKQAVPSGGSLASFKMRFADCPSHL